MRTLFSMLVCCLGLLAAAPVTAADAIHLRIARLLNDRHVYYVALIREALREDGHPVDITLVDSMPQLRLWSAVHDGQLSLIWGVPTQEREQQFIGVDNRLTNGLVGERVLMVRKGMADDYARVRTLDDFRALHKVGGAGEGWFDVELWQRNRLPLMVRKGDWSVLFRMVAQGDRGVDYIIRGANEVVFDSKANPDLEIEPHLVLSHDRDMRLYLGPGNAALKPVLEHALARADRSGLKKRLIAEYLLPSVASLHLDERVHLDLDTPPL